MGSPFLWEPHTGLGWAGKGNSASLSCWGLEMPLGVTHIMSVYKHLGNGFTVPDVSIGTSVLQIYSRNKAKLCIN